jgi:hypothetical protein
VRLWKKEKKRENTNNCFTKLWSRVL